ncbi:NUDIX hydrolase [Microbacterium sp. 22242]|uniref:NUDIX hydrolase n=1 Tax=Microbacterium sp. 22242 TaxID=3453896 RepID=UPI003F84E95E
MTGYTVTSDRSHLLMVFHRKLQRWLPPGGHVDDNEFPSAAVLREVYEETGVHASHRREESLDLALEGVIDVQLPTPLTMSAQLIPATAEDPEHIHIDMMYELVGDRTPALSTAEREVAGARWFARAEVLSEPRTFDAVRAFARERLRQVD